MNKISQFAAVLTDNDDVIHSVWESLHRNVTIEEVREALKVATAVAGKIISDNEGFPMPSLVTEYVEVHTDLTGGKAIVSSGMTAKDIIDILPIGSSYRTVRVKRYGNAKKKWKKIEASQPRLTLESHGGPPDSNPMHRMGYGRGDG